MEVRMGHIWEPYMGAVHGSKNGPYVRVIMGYTWEPYMGAVHGSYIWEPYMEVRMGHI